MDYRLGSGGLPVGFWWITGEVLVDYRLGPGG